MTASESVLRPRSRRSSSATLGGRMNTLCELRRPLADLARALPIDLEHDG